MALVSGVEVSTLSARAFLLENLPTFAEFERRLDAFNGTLVSSPISQHFFSEPRINRTFLKTEPLKGKPKPQLFNEITNKKTDHYQPVSSENKSYFEIYKKTLKKKIPFKGDINLKAPDRKETQIKELSSQSKQRLMFTSVNAFPVLCSQFVATYHNYVPIDGKELKRHLNSFLQRIRYRFPGVGYLWVLEFQGRGVPHFHIFLTIPATDENWKYLGKTWNRIADKTSKDHLKWHSERITKKKGKEYKALIDWSMGSGSYLCKYLYKDYQKEVPAGFRNVGRFWGASRGLVPEPDFIPFDIIDETLNPVNDTLPSTFVIRQLGRYHEKINPYLRKKFNHSRFKDKISYSITTGSDVFWHLLRYLTGLTYSTA